MNRGEWKKNLLFMLSQDLSNMTIEDYPLGVRHTWTDAQIRIFNDAKAELMDEFDRRAGV